jgi:hypothetical protein
MLIESASCPTTRSSVPHQGQDPHKAFADLALCPLRSAEIAVGLSSCADYVSKADHTLLSKRPASVEALRGDPMRDGGPVDSCSAYDAGSSIAVKSSSGWSRGQILPRSIGRGSWCSKDSR